MRLLPFLCALALLLPFPFRAHALQVESLVQNGPPSNRIDLVILGDGYRTEDQELLRTDAEALVASLFSLQPFKDARSLFNVKLVHVISNENGADRGSYGATRNTALGSYFFCGGIERLLCVDQTAVQRLAAAEVPEFDVALVVVNDPKYGGAGGSVPVTSTNESSSEIVRHELGHTLAGLADEYTTPYPGFPACSVVNDCPEANASLRSTLPTSKWAHWIDPGTPMPTPVGTHGVGAFEGARYQPQGVFRPVDRLCLMQFLGEPLCPVCAEAMSLAFWERVNPLDSASPAANSTLRLRCGPTTSVELKTSLPAAALEVTWRADGELLPFTGPRQQLDGWSVPPGTRKLSATLHDPTPRIRRDPQSLTTERLEWPLDLERCDGGRPSTASSSSASSSSGGSSGSSGGEGSSTGGGTTGEGSSTGGTPPATPPPGCGCRGGAGGLEAFGFLALAALRRRENRPRKGG